MAQKIVNPYERREQLLQSMHGHVGTTIRPESTLEKVAHLAIQRRRIAEGRINPYKRRFYNFLAHCLWTIDEARGGQVRKWPTGAGDDGQSWDQVWLEMEDALLRSKLLFIEKSRRVLASWCVCA